MKTKATTKQVRFALRLLQEKGFSTRWMNGSFSVLGATMRERQGKVSDWLESLNVAECSTVIKTLQEL